MTRSALVAVGFGVEAHEHGEEESCFDENDRRVELGVAAAYEEWHDDVNEHDDELHQLELGEVALPPEVRADGWTHK